MLARLWWKEYRAFGPVWLILIGAAAVVQWLLISAGSEDVRAGALTPTALVWAVLYAFATGAAAFAGEREARTLGFLDALPAPRPTLWLGKVTFALVSTFGLAIALAVLAAIGTQTRDPAQTYGYVPLARGFGVILFEAVAWGLLWSSMMTNPLPAGAMAVVSVGFMSILANILIDPSRPTRGDDLVVVDTIPIRLLAASAAMAISALILVGRHGTGWSRRDRWTPRAIGTAIDWRSSAARSLEWQTFREGWPTWVLVMAIGLTIPAGTAILGVRSEGTMGLGLAMLVSLVAGVSVFGPENVAGTRRFLVHHGASPGLVWGRKLLVWGTAMAVFLALFLFGSSWQGIPRGFAQPSNGLFSRLLPFTTLIDAFAVGVLSGMAIRRRITAALVGVIAVLAIAPLQIGLAVMAMIPSWSLLLTPAILLGVSRGWAGDWMMGREGARPWVRLGALLVSPSILLGSAYVAYRAWGEPAIGPLLDPAAVQAQAVPPGVNAAETYRKAIARARLDLPTPNGPGALGDDEVIERGWNPEKAEVVAWWKENQAAIELTRTASAMPLARFEDVERSPLDSERDGAIVDIQTLARLLALDTRERLSRGDLPGAWEDIRAQLRMANQLGTTTPTLTQMLMAASIHHRALGLAFDWASDPGQSAETIRAARNDLDRLPPLPSIAESLRVESLILDRTLDLPAEELARVAYLNLVQHRPSILERVIFNRFVAAPWERLRARRVSRRILGGQIPDANREPWQRTPGAIGIEPLDPTFGGSPLTRLLLPATQTYVERLDREMVLRRAIEQVLAIRSWQFGHGGESPETLQDLVPSELPRLPIDPYAGRPFGYIRSTGQPIWPPIRFDFGPFDDLRPTRVGQRLIYSVGPDRKDDRGTRAIDFRSERRGNQGDLIYPVP